MRNHSQRTLPGRPARAGATPAEGPAERRSRLLNSFAAACIFWGLAACGGASGSSALGPDAAADADASAGADTALGGSDIASPPVECVLTDLDPDWAPTLGCEADFRTLASEPVDASIPGALSLKTVIDRVTGDTLHFQNSKRFPIHYAFASTHLSGAGLPLVPPLAQFNTTEYYSPDRRFLLGAVTWYQEPDVWAYEISPYDTASAEMIQTAFERIRAAAWFGPTLVFHPTSEAVESEATKLPPSIPVMRSEELFAGITYQALNVATAVGRLRFTTAAEAEVGPLDFRDLVVLDSIPNDIGVVAGIITATFQTALSHINVLSQNRGTPNMAQLGVFEDPALRALDGRWVELRVGPFDWSIREVTQAEADAWWEAHKPAGIAVPSMNLDVTALTDIEEVLDLSAGLGPALAAAIPAFGGKASHYGTFHAMRSFDDGTPIVPVPKAFAIPLYYYMQHLTQNGLDADIAALLADPQVGADPLYRDAALEALRDKIAAAPIDADFLGAVSAKLAADYPGVRMRFRSSTNGEDLDGFTGAGLYTSKSGDPSDPERPVDAAIKDVWASVWTSRAFQEREYRSIDHTGIGMALLVHQSFPDEEANGVALTGNPFNTSGLEPGFFVNVQVGELSVVKPEPGVTTDSFIYHYDFPGSPISFLSHSNQVLPGRTVLSAAQTYRLGQALSEIHRFFAPLYGSGTGAIDGFYAMDVEFKFDAAADETPRLFMKQARPYGGSAALSPPQ
ncbi:MAG: PEP/pyruvate-binding domain-containing protein [Myxococcota bacterium]